VKLFVVLNIISSIASSRIVLSTFCLTIFKIATAIDNWNTVQMPLILTTLLYATPVLGVFTTPKVKDAWHIGDEVTIAWNSDWPVWGNGPVSPELLDLWITTYENASYAQKLAGMFRAHHYTYTTDRSQEITNVKSGGETNWTINVPEEYIVGLNGLVFRFKEHRDGDERHGGWQYASYATFPMFPAVEAESFSRVSRFAASTLTMSSSSTTTSSSIETTASSETTITS
jgi:hypothetical protein